MVFQVQSGPAEFPEMQNVIALVCNMILNHLYLLTNEE